MTYRTREKEFYTSQKPVETILSDVLHIILIHAKNIKSSKIKVSASSFFPSPLHDKSQRKHVDLKMF